MTAAESAERAQHYDPREIQEKWQARWAEMDLFRASDDPEDPRPRTYLLDMFPYPSGDLHMGHAEAYALGDAMARYYNLRGHNVLKKSFVLRRSIVIKKSIVAKGHNVFNWPRGGDAALTVAWIDREHVAASSLVLVG